MGNILIKPDDLPLQSLKIPKKWYVQHNNFYDITPEAEIYVEGWPNGNKWLFFEEDLFCAKYGEGNILIDLGWYNANDPEGQFHLILIKNNEWATPLYEFSSRNKDEIVDKLNELMADVAAGKIK